MELVGISDDSCAEYPFGAVVVARSFHCADTHLAFVGGLDQEGAMVPGIPCPQSANRVTWSSSRYAPGHPGLLVIDFTSITKPKVPASRGGPDRASMISVSAVAQR